MFKQVISITMGVFLLCGFAWGNDDAFVTKMAVDCCNHDGTRGDVNYDMAGPNIADLTYLVDYLFNSGLPPPCLPEGNLNGDTIPGETCCNHDGIRCDINYDMQGPDFWDYVYMVEYLFNGGPPPPCWDEAYDLNGDGSSNLQDLGCLDPYTPPYPPECCAPCPEPEPIEKINVEDLTYLVAYLFAGGPPPEQCP